MLNCRILISRFFIKGDTGLCFYPKNIHEYLYEQEKKGALTRAKRRRHEKKKFKRFGKWQPPSYGVLKINTDGSSRGNLGPSRIGGIGRDAMGSVIFIFSIYDGIQTINLVEGLAILATLEKAHALGWRRIVCESDSQVLINMLIE